MPENNLPKWASPFSPMPSSAPPRAAPGAPMGHYIELTANDGHKLRAFQVEPARPAQAALVLLQEMDQRSPDAGRAHAAAGPTLPGVNAHIRAMAREYAAHGYHVLCPSTFGRGRSGRDYGYRFEDASGRGPRIVKPLEPLPSKLVLLDVQAAIAHAHRYTRGAPVALVGYCWGGLLAWRAAALPAAATVVRAAVCFYGGGMTGREDLELRPQVPVQVHLPSDEAWMPLPASQAFARLQAERVASGGPGAEVHVYEAPYGFAHPGRRSHDERAATLARQRSLAFLSRQLLGR